jgi:hypothetical protein
MSSTKTLIQLDILPSHATQKEQKERSYKVQYRVWFNIKRALFGYNL